jgi:FkbM family methyltransferase
MSGQWQPESFEAIASGLPIGGVFLDVGAHIGYFSIKAALRVGKSGGVVAFEPNPETLTILRANVAASNLENVVIKPVACAHREGSLVLYASPAGNTGMSSLARQNALSSFAKAPRAFTVRTRPIDDIVHELGLKRVDAMSVDVEGAEFIVLQGAKETLKRLHPKLVIEVDEAKFSQMGGDG